MLRTLFTMLGFFVLECQAQPSLEVELALGRPHEGGSMRLAICPNESAFEQEKGCATRIVPATGSLVQLSVAGLSPGLYAVKVFHDVNDNGKLDTNWMGIPNEPYGFSNDAMGTFGPPGFKEASFLVGEGRTTIRIKMKG